MRVLMLSWEFPPHLVGGMGRHVTEIASALANLGIDLHVVTPQVESAPAYELLANVLSVHRVPCDADIMDRARLISMVQRANADLARAAVRLHQERGGFDLIHGHDWLVAESSIALQNALARPLVTTVHSLEHGRMQGSLITEQSLAIHRTERWLTHSASRIIAVSRYMQQQISAVFDLPTSIIDVIYNGVVPASRPALDEQQRTAIRRTYAQPGDHIVSYVGRLVYEKGVHVLIEAVPQLLQHMSNVRVVIAGTGPVQEQLHQQARDRGVDDHIHFAGYISDQDRDNLLAVADVAVFPSLYEPFGIVALEAMSLGCPVVASATGGFAEIVRPHETGILTEPHNAASLAWGVLHTLQNAEWAATRVSNAKHDLATVYSWQRIAAQTICTYEHAISLWKQHTGQDAHTKERWPAAPQHSGPGEQTLPAAIHL